MLLEIFPSNKKYFKADGVINNHHTKTSDVCKKPLHENDFELNLIQIIHFVKRGENMKCNISKSIFRRTIFTKQKGSV